MSNKENFLRDIPNLKEKVYKNISKDNEDLINFLDIFSQFSKNTNNIKEFIYSNEEISKNFFNLIKLNKNNLEDILDILNCIKENSKNEDLEIYAKELDRGIYELEWIIEEKKLYQSIFENFEDNILSKNSILMISVFCISHIPAILTLDIEGFEDKKLLLMIFLILVVQSSDVLQYVWGKLFGKHKIAPKLSPSKTVEGFVGGVVSASVLGGLLYWLTPFNPV